MKKFYVLTVCVLFSVFLSAQTFYWVGPSTGSAGNWNTAANWSNTSGGSGGAGVPNSLSHNVIFDQGALVNINITSIALSTFTVTNSTNAVLFTTAGTTINLHGTDPVNTALKINAGSALLDSANADVDFLVNFQNNTKGIIDGTWRFAGSTPLNLTNGSLYAIPSTPGLSNQLDINGTIIHGVNTAVPDFFGTGDEYVFFNSGSVFQLEMNTGADIPNVSWHANSTIKILGTRTSSVSLTESDEIGNLIYDSPNQSEDELDQITLSLRNITVQGDLQILNTNSMDLIILGNGFGGSPQTLTTTVLGNFDISGTSRVVVSDVNAPDKTIVLEIQGDVNADGLSFDLQKNVQNNIVDNSTTLKIGGDLNHTAGTFTSTAVATSNTVDLYVVELNGSGNQTVSSVTNTINNASNQLTLRLNKAGGTASLLTPLTVGRLSFDSPDKGILTTTSTNILTINNTSLDNLTVNSPDNTGFINGPLRRRTASPGLYSFPTGKGGTLRAIEITPASAAASVYEAEYFNAAYTDLSVEYPIRRVSNQEYWNVNRISGANASIGLSLNGTIPGSNSDDIAVVARYNGTDWINARGTNGTTITPGNSTSGNVQSDVQSVFGLFTLGLETPFALAIRLLSFDARKSGANNAEISWKVTSNSTPDYFEVLKSTNGRDFSIAATLSGVEGQENYNLTDNNLSSGTTYYRLRMIDKDGTASFSKVIAVMNGKTGVLITSMMPTLVTSRSRLNISSSEKGGIQLVVTDLHGRLIQQQISAIVPGNQEVWLNLHSLAKGAYQVTGYFNGERITTIRFIKQ